MHSAAVYGRVDAVRRLHELGAKVDAPAANGCLPIHLAARAGQVESVKVSWSPQHAVREQGTQEGQKDESRCEFVSACCDSVRRQQKPK